MQKRHSKEPGTAFLPGARRIGQLLASANAGRSGLVFVIFLFSTTVILFVGLAYLCWFIAIPKLWEWGFDQGGWRSIFAVLGNLYVGMFPLLTVFFFIIGIEFWDGYESTRRELTSVRQQQGEVENQLDIADPQYPLKLIRYSRFMLKEYYIMAMRQAQRSYRCCLIAMWLGFLVLLAGVADYFIPLRSLLASSFTLVESLQVQTASGLKPSELVLITGIVLEFIAIAFLWVYRFSIKQQTYYYRRQLKLHNMLLAKHVGDDMKDGKDEALKLIMQSLLENEDFVQMEPPKISWLKSRLKER